MPRRLVLIALALCLICACLVFVELVRSEGAVTLGIVLGEVWEKGTLIAGMAGVVWAIQGVRDLREGQKALTNNLARAAAQGESWREDRQPELAALGLAIEDEFRKWQLSPAEIDIAGLMLKGATFKEIALARDTSEATIRQQAQSIYRKSGLSGRAELSAYFLESLFDATDEFRQKRTPALIKS